MIRSRIVTDDEAVALEQYGECRWLVGVASTHTISMAFTELSTRNQLPGTVTGEAMSIVDVELAGGQSITSSVTKDAVDDLGSWSAAR